MYTNNVMCDMNNYMNDERSRMIDDYKNIDMRHQDETMSCIVNDLMIVEGHV